MAALRRPGPGEVPNPRRRARPLPHRRGGTVPRGRVGPGDAVHRVGRACAPRLQEQEEASAPSGVRAVATLAAGDNARAAGSALRISGTVAAHPELCVATCAERSADSVRILEGRSGVGDEVPTDQLTHPASEVIDGARERKLDVAKFQEILIESDRLRRTQAIEDKAPVAIARTGAGGTD